MNKKAISITLVLVLLIGTGALTYALADDWGRRGRGMHGGRMFGHGIMRMLRSLDLSDDQKEQVRSALMTSRKTAIVSRAQLRVARMELHEALMQDSIDDAAVGKLADQIAELQGALLQNRISVQRSINSVLTPEQRRKARIMVLERVGHGPGGRFHHGRGYGRSHGDGEGYHRGPKQRH